MGTIDVDVTHEVKYLVDTDGKPRIFDDKFELPEAEVFRLILEDMEDVEP